MVVYLIHQVLTGVTLSMYSKYKVFKIVFFFVFFKCMNLFILTCTRSGSNRAQHAAHFLLKGLLSYPV